jgi:hypothetical protein
VLHDNTRAHNEIQLVFQAIELKSINFELLTKSYSLRAIRQVQSVKKLLEQNITERLAFLKSKIF